MKPEPWRHFPQLSTLSYSLLELLGELYSAAVNVWLAVSGIFKGHFEYIIYLISF